MHPRKTSLRILSAFVLLAAANVIARDSTPIEKFTAFAASLERGKAGVVDIAITRWSTDEERERLLTTLQEFGRDKLIDELQKIKPPVGYVRTPATLAYDLYYARNHALPDGSRRIVLATNRPVSFREVVGSARSKDYQFTLIELHIGKDGKGEGKIVPAARVTWDKAAKKIEIENYNALPVDLLQVNAQKP